MARKTSILFACLTTALLLPLVAAHDDEHQWGYPLDGYDDPYEVPEDHSNIMVSANDLALGQNVALSVCWLNPYGDDRCDAEEDLISDIACGAIHMNAPWAGGTVEVYTYTVAASQDLSAVCAATAGTVTVKSW